MVKVRPVMVVSPKLPFRSQIAAVVPIRVMSHFENTFF
ncbi:hypothetical protein [Roseobacter sp. A03A-229]